MKHDRLDIILQAVCRCNDYMDADALIKASELKERLHPINHSMNNKHSLEALYGILAATMNLIKEIECTNVTTVDESSNQSQDLLIIAKDVQLNQK